MINRRIALLVLLWSICSLTTVYSQNTIEIASFRSPQFDFNYEQSDSVDIEVVLENKGPNIILGTDRIHFDIKVTADDTTLFYNASEFATFNIAVNNPAIFTLLRDYKLDYESNYQICVSVSGTDQYPNNFAKDPQTCISFVVGIEEEILEANKLFYADNQLFFDLNRVLPSLRYRILDLSGKLLNDGQLDPQKRQSIAFDPPARGLYFIQLQKENGQQSTYKFVVK